MTQNLKKMRFLVADDEAGWRDLLSFELFSQERDIVTACSAHEALKLLDQQSFDLIISDVQMPGHLDGIDLIQTYRREKPAQKAILITGYAVEEKIERALADGAVLFLKKPFESEDLFKAIDCLLHA